MWVPSGAGARTFAAPAALSTWVSLHTASPAIGFPPKYATAPCGVNATGVESPDNPLAAKLICFSPALDEYSKTAEPAVKYALLLSLSKSAAVTPARSNAWLKLARASYTNTLLCAVSDTTTLLPSFDTANTDPVMPLAVPVTVLVPASRITIPADVPRKAMLPTLLK